MKCRVCAGPAVIDVRRHNAAFCPGHFVEHCHEQVRRALTEHDMLSSGDRVVVAVSGGKDSLALWHILGALGHAADGVHLGLGIGDYSETSREQVRAFAAERSLRLHEVEVADELGAGIPAAAEVTRRSPCGACGLSKRHLLNRFALGAGYDVVATGHNLDDEAAVLLGNVLRWDVEYLRRQQPVLPSGPGFCRRVKPLVRLAERETAAYCVIVGIDYQVDECPLGAGNRHLRYKETLALLEDRSPGAKAAFVQGFFRHGRDAFVEHAAAPVELHACAHCGAPTTGTVCAFCRLKARLETTPARSGS